jgi:hypothetical protein
LSTKISFDFLRISVVAKILSLNLVSVINFLFHLKKFTQQAPLIKGHDLDKNTQEFKIPLTPTTKREKLVVLGKRLEKME